MLRSVFTLATCAVLGWSAAAAEPAEADTGPSLQSIAAPDAPPPDGAAPAADSGAPQGQAAPPVDDARVESSPPANTKSPDGWTLTVSAHDETEMPVPSLTNEAATRELIVGGTFNSLIRGPAGAKPPEGTLEVGYQIACGGDISSTPGIVLQGSIGLLPAAGVAVNLKPGLVNIVPVTKKEFKGADPWVMISGFSLKIDGCIGSSFIRSYATLTKATDTSDVIVSYYGTTRIN
jgi:hypothetical protein